jgi:hypothetical protein
VEKIKKGLAVRLRKSLWTVQNMAGNDIIMQKNMVYIYGGVFEDE